MCRQSMAQHLPTLVRALSQKETVLFLVPAGCEQIYLVFAPNRSTLVEKGWLEN